MHVYALYFLSLQYEGIKMMPVDLNFVTKKSKDKTCNGVVYGQRRFIQSRNFSRIKNVNIKMQSCTTLNISFI